MEKKWYNFHLKQKMSKFASLPAIYFNIINIIQKVEKHEKS